MLDINQKDLLNCTEICEARNANKIFYKSKKIKIVIEHNMCVEDTHEETYQYQYTIENINKSTEIARFIKNLNFSDSKF